MPLKKMIPQFLLWLLQEKDYKDTTFKNYEHHMRYFMEWYGGDNKISNITVDTIREYREYLKSWKSLTTGRLIYKSTREEKIKVIKKFLQFCNVKDIPAIHPSKIEIFKDKRLRKVSLKDRELERLLNSPDTTTPLGIRDRAIMEFLFSTGVRLEEITTINKQQVDWEAKQITIKGKGGKIRTVYLNENAIFWLQKYLEIRIDDYESLFTHSNKRNFRSNGYIGKRTVYEVIKKYANKSGVGDWVGPHTFRHTYCTFLLEHGATMKEVQELAGHASLRSTELYLHYVNKPLQNIHQKIMNQELSTNND